MKRQHFNDAWTEKTEFDDLFITYVRIGRCMQTNTYLTLAALDPDPARGVFVPARTVGLLVHRWRTGVYSPTAGPVTFIRDPKGIYPNSYRCGGAAYVN